VTERIKRTFNETQGSSERMFHCEGKLFMHGEQVSKNGRPVYKCYNSNFDEVGKYRGSGNTNKFKKKEPKPEVCTSQQNRK
jgi:hypothetical protein